MTKSEHKKAHQIAQSVASLFLDDRLYQLAKERFLATWELPDLAELSANLAAS
jgi:hypothetical protein